VAKKSRKRSVTRRKRTVRRTTRKRSVRKIKRILKKSVRRTSKRSVRRTSKKSVKRLSKYKGGAGNDDNFVIRFTYNYNPIEDIPELDTPHPISGEVRRVNGDIITISNRSLRSTTSSINKNRIIEIAWAGGNRVLYNQFIISNGLESRDRSSIDLEPHDLLFTG
jgi:hypothetical protein